MDLTIGGLEPEANTHDLQLLTTVACFLLSVFSQVNSQSYAIVEEDGEKTTNYSAENKQKTTFLSQWF